MKLTIEYRNGPGVTTDRYRAVISADLIADGRVLQVIHRDLNRIPIVEVTTCYSMHNVTWWMLTP